MGQAVKNFFLKKHSDCQLLLTDQSAQNKHTIIIRAKFS